jgi:hypothetical protein
MLAWWDDVTLGPDLGITGVSRDEVRTSMGWLLGRQRDIEAALARRHLAADGIAVFGLSSFRSSFRAREACCWLADGGSPGRGGPAREDVVYGLLTDLAGCPIAIRVLSWGTAGSAALIEAAQSIGGAFGLGDLVVAGSPGVITSARIRAMREAGRLSWITPLRSCASRAPGAGVALTRLARCGQRDLSETRHPDYPGERLLAWPDPPVPERPGRLRDLAAIRAGSGGVRVIRTSLPAWSLDGPGTAALFTALSRVQREFESMMAHDRDTRPLHRRPDDGARAHALICMLSAYLVRHLRATLAPVTQLTAGGHGVPSFSALLDHLATLTRATVTVGNTSFEAISEPTPVQRRAFDLLGAPMPVSLIL